MRAEVGELVRFFRVAPPVPPLMVTTFTALTIVASVAIVIDESYGAGMVNAVLLLQLFAVSSAFGSSARRGYFDLLLTRGHRRAAIGFAHCAWSAAPGVLSWLAMSTLEVAVHSGSPPVGLASGTVVAMLVVSAMGWAVSVSLPRFSGAIGWLVIVASAAALDPPDVVPGLEYLVYPVAMVGRSLQSDPVAFVVPVVISVAGLVAALVWIESADIRLEASQ